MPLFHEPAAAQSIRSGSPSVAGTPRLWGSIGELPSDGVHIIRHYWDKPVACKNPLYGRWGGPPGRGDEGQPGAIKPAEGLASAPRGQIKLPNVVQSAVPELGLAAKQRALRPGEKAPAKE